MSKNNEKIVDSWNELSNLLFSYEKDEITNRYRSNFVYRGVDNKAFDLKSSYHRLEKKGSNIEKHINRNFIKYTDKELQKIYNVWDYLSIAQHHGLPTRLLDWSFSPYVALHFATGDISLYGEDAALWCVNLVDVHNKLDPMYKNVLKEEGSYVFTTKMMSNLSKELIEFDSEHEGKRLCFFEPPSLDERIINQFALFSVINNPDISINDWLRENDNVNFLKIIIPKELKWEVRDKLDQMNITERVLFPGLDGISTWLKRYYTNNKKSK